MLTSLHRHKDWGLLALRVAIGVIFLYHGLLKWPLNPAAPWYMQALAFVEPICAVAIILGLLSQWAALVLSVVMLGAIYMKMTGFGQAAMDVVGTFAPQGATGWEFDLMILAGCVMILLAGGGKYALDATLWKKK